MTARGSRRRRRASNAGARRVLVFDEHEGSRTVTCHVLAAEGHIIEAVSSVRALLAAVERFRPDVVIYEWNLRNDAGIGLAAKLHARAAARQLTVIAVSTLNEPDGFRTRESVQAYFTKPLDMAVLDRAVRGRG